MTRLRAQMIRKLELRRAAPKTIKAYVQAVKLLAKFYGRSPDQLTVDEVQSYLHHLLTERKLAASSVNQAVCAIRYFYHQVLGRKEFRLEVRSKRSGRLPEILSRSELERLFNAAQYPKHRAMLVTTYAAGLRASETVALQPRHIDSQRMLIRVENGKGGKDRYTLLSPQLLDELRIYWRLCRPRQWLFPGRDPAQPMSRETAGQIYRRCKHRAGIHRRGGIHTLRHCFATGLLEAGVDLPTIQQLMGHTDIKTTMRYLRIAPRRLSQLSSALDLLCLPDSLQPPPTRTD